MLPRALDILRQVHAARTTVKSLGRNVGGRLAVGCVPTIMPYFLAPKLSGFTADYPEVEVHLVEDVTSNLVERRISFPVFFRWYLRVWEFRYSRKWPPRPVAGAAFCGWSGRLTGALAICGSGSTRWEARKRRSSTGFGPYRSEPGELPEEVS